MRQEPLDHLLLFGPLGLGKPLYHRLWPMLWGIKICRDPWKELVIWLLSFQALDILFIDEIHRMPIAVEEVLYSAMEQFKVDVVIGQGAGAKSINLPLHPFTLIGATTKRQNLALYAVDLVLRKN